MMRPLRKSLFLIMLLLAPAGLTPALAVEAV